MREGMDYIAQDSKHKIIIIHYLVILTISLKNRGLFHLMCPFMGSGNNNELIIISDLDVKMHYNLVLTLKNNAFQSNYISTTLHKWFLRQCTILNLSRIYVRLFAFLISLDYNNAHMCMKIGVKVKKIIHCRSNCWLPDPSNSILSFVQFSSMMR